MNKTRILKYPLYLQELETTLLKCPKCSKTYKTKGWLERHSRIKHSETPFNAISADDMKNLVEKTKKKIAENERYPLEIRSAFTQVVEYKQDALKAEVQSAYLEWKEHNDIDLFYSKYQENMIKQFSDMLIKFINNKPLKNRVCKK